MKNLQPVVGGGLILMAAILFAATMYWHDSRTAPVSPFAMAGRPVPQDVAQQLSKLPYRTSTQHAYLGQVRSAGNGSITFVSAVVDPATGAQSTTTLTALITPSTELFKQGTQKSDAQYQDDMDAFLKIIAYATTTGRIYAAPDHFTHVPLTVADFTPGSYVEAEPAAEVQGSSFSAASVRLIVPVQ